VDVTRQLDVWAFNTFLPVWAGWAWRNAAKQNVFGQDVVMPKNPNLIQTAIAPEFNDAARWMMENIPGMPRTTGQNLHDALRSLAPGVIAEAVESQTQLPHRQKLGRKVTLPVIGRLWREFDNNPWGGPMREIYDSAAAKKNAGVPIGPTEEWLLKQYDTRMKQATAGTTASERADMSRENQYALLREIQAQRARIATEIYAEYLRRKALE
jgi:hypothetical protein